MPFTLIFLQYSEKKKRSFMEIQIENILSVTRIKKNVKIWRVV